MEYLHTLWMVQRSLAIAIAGPALGLQHIHTSAATRAGDIGLDDRSRQIERQSPNRGAAECQCQRLSQCVGDCKGEGQNQDLLRPCVSTEASVTQIRRANDITLRSSSSVHYYPMLLLMMEMRMEMRMERQ